MQNHYHLISISVILTILYVLSFSGAKAGIYSLKFHAKIWNSLLLISFIVAGFLGFFLVIQINYKIEIPIIDTIMLFHVDFGIALFLISVFHILFHLSYFTNLFKSVKTNNKSIQLESQIQPESGETILIKNWKLFYSLIILGISTIISQILFIREYISVFSGNELLIGIVLSNWLILTGLGAYSAQFAIKIRKSINLLYILHVLLGSLPILIMLSIFLLKNQLFTIGTQINYVQLYFFSLFLLFPLCFISGFSFSQLSKLLSAKFIEPKIHVSYSVESLGSLIGGFLFSFVMVFVLTTFQSLILLLFINLAAIFFLAGRTFSIYQKSGLILIGISTLLSAFIFDLDNYSKRFLFPNQEIVSINQSPYGQIIITENNGQLNFHQNGTYIFSSDSNYANNANIAFDEESVHFVMLQHPHPKNVLVLSGGIGGCMTELMKYPVQSIDYVELDPLIIKLALSYNPVLKSKKISSYNMDAREYLQKSKKNYDMVLVNIAPPSGTETNRFYTQEFFAKLKSHMAPESHVILSLPSTVNYFDSLALMSNRVIFNTLSELFKNVQVFPGEKNYFIASDSSVHTNIVERIAKEKIPNEYISYYLDDESIKGRSELMMQQIRGKSPINKDLKPLSYLIQIKSHWQIFSDNYWIMIVFFMLILFFIFRKFNAARFGMFAAGFSSITAELTIIYLFQMVFGNAYQIAGIVFTVFMTGLVIGPLIPIRSIIPTKIAIVASLFAMGILAMAIPFILKTILDTQTIKLLVYLAFFFSTLIVAINTAYLFKLSALLIQNQGGNIAGEIYSADLYGSAIGALIISILIIPYLGIIFSGLPGGILCMIAAIFLFKSK